MAASRVTRRLAAVPEAQHRDGAYVRVSALMGRAGDDLLSPAIQLDTITSASARTGGAVVQVWEDLDVSGRSMTRPGLAAAQAAARDGSIDRLFVYDLSRFARNAAGGLTELAAIEATGVEVVSATELLDRKTSTGRFTAALLLAMAEQRSDQIGEAWQRAILQNAERGVWHGRPPRGYVRTDRRSLAPHPVEGPLWAEAFRRYADGEGLRVIGGWLSTATGKTVLPSEVSRTLRSPAYLGQVVLAGKVFPGRHEPLVDQATWERVQARLDLNRREPSRTKQGVHSLAGLLRCGSCGGALYRRPRKQRGGTFVFCSTATYGPDGDCDGIGFPALPPIEQEVLRQFTERVRDWSDDSAAQAERHAARLARAVATARDVAEETAKTERALGMLAVKLAEGVLSDTAYSVASGNLERALDGLRARASELTDHTARPSFAAAVDLAEATLELWPTMTTQDQNAAIRTHVRTVTVAAPTKPRSRAPRNVTVDWII